MIKDQSKADCKVYCVNISKTGPGAQNDSMFNRKDKGNTPELAKYYQKA